MQEASQTGLHLNVMHHDGILHEFNGVAKQTNARCQVRFLKHDGETFFVEASNSLKTSAPYGEGTGKIVAPGGQGMDGTKRFPPGPESRPSSPLVVSNARAPHRPGIRPIHDRRSDDPGAHIQFQSLFEATDSVLAGEAIVINKQNGIT